MHKLFHFTRDVFDVIKKVVERSWCTRVNNGTCILQLCEDTDIAVVNNVKYGYHHFKSTLSFCKKTNWISEPDLLLASDHALLEFKLNFLNISMD